jgi:hypothetical protein
MSLGAAQHLPALAPRRHSAVRRKYVRVGALTPAAEASPLAERPYGLRHASLSIWLSAGVAPAQVAEWADNRVPVVLRVYARRLTDSEPTALRRIESCRTRAGG